MFNPTYAAALTPILTQFAERLMATGLERDAELMTAEQIISTVTDEMNLKYEPDLYPYGFRLDLHIHNGLLNVGVHPTLSRAPSSASRAGELAVHPAGKRPGDGWVSVNFVDPDQLPAHPCEEPAWTAHLTEDGDFPERPCVQALHRMFLHVTDLLAAHRQTMPSPGQRFTLNWGRWMPAPAQPRRGTHQGFLWAPGEHEPEDRLVTEARTSDTLAVRVTGDDSWHEIAILDGDVHISASELQGRSYWQACQLFHQRDVAAIRRSV